MKYTWDDLYIEPEQKIGKYECLNEDCQHKWEENVKAFESLCPKCRNIYIRCKNIHELFGTKKSVFR